jgi:Dyp-type peroxidase family
MARTPSKSPEPGRTRIRTITTFAAVPDDQLPELTRRLRELKPKPSPFAAVPGTHFARLAVLDREKFDPQPRPKGMRGAAWLIDLVTHLGRPQKADPPSRSYLLFSANYDAAVGVEDHREYLDGLRLHLKQDADLLFGLCADYPGWAEQERFLAFFAERSLPHRYLFTASDAEPSVERTRSALKLRQQVIDLALETEGLSDVDLVKRFRADFTPATEPQARPAAELASIHPAAEPALVDPPTGADLLANAGQVATEPNLDDVQNLVSSGYPRHESARHLLLRITDPVPARRWLARVADEIPTAGWAGGYVDRLEYETLERSAPRSESGNVSPGFAVHVALSYAGLARLGLPESELAGFSTEFQSGMASREAGLAPGRGTDPWLPPFAPADASAPAGESAVDVLVMFSGTDARSLKNRFADRPELFPTPADGLQLLQQIEAGRIRVNRPATAEDSEGGTKVGFLEHFGFVDGLSQPRIHGVTPGRRVAELPAGEALLGYQDIDGDTAGAGLPTALARNGSYLVYRKLEQDVPAFRALTRELGGRLADQAPDGVDPEQLAAAKLMGRWRDGTPLTPDTEAAVADATGVQFGFQQHDAEGHGCPVGAHIRRANPRDSRPVDPNAGADTGGEAGLEAKLTLRHRMLRRGIPYGTMLPDDAEAGSGERGLLFVALVGDLRRQFEFVQAHWMSDGNAFRLGTDRDVLSGAGEQGNKFVVQGEPPTFVQPTTPLVTCRGGEYFFLPGITALKRIATG